MAEGILGLGSGASTNLNQELIDKLKAAERKATVEPLETKIGTYDKRNEIFTELDSSVKNFLNAVKPFDLFVKGGINAFNEKQASTSGDSVVFSANSTNELNNGTMVVDVKQIAQKDVYQTDFISEADFNSENFVNKGNLSITVDGKTTTIDTSDLTYKKLEEKLNFISGVNASMDDVGNGNYRLVMKSEQTGVEHALKISGDAASALGVKSDSYQTSDIAGDPSVIQVDKGEFTLKVGDDNKVFNTDGKTYTDLVNELKAEGVDAEITTNPDGKFKLSISSKNTENLSGNLSNDLTLTPDSNHVLTATNMKAVIDGVDYEKSVNSLKVDGLVVMPSKEGISSITVSSDTSSVLTKVKAFVEQYNNLASSVDNVTSVDSKMDNKSDLRQVMSQVKNELFKTYGDDEKSIFGYGIELDMYGKLTINEEDFNKALENDKDGLEELFVGTAEGKGLGTLLKESLDKMSFSDGVLTNYKNNMDSSLTNLKEEKEAEEKKLNEKYDQLAKQFASYTTIIEQMNREFSGLEMLIKESTTSK